MSLPTAGLGFKPGHFAEAIAVDATGFWLEIHPENYMVDGGPRSRMLDALRRTHPLSLHGVSLSLGGPHPPDEDHLHLLAAMVHRVEPVLISEHLAWSRIDGRYEPDLLPIVRDAATLGRLCRHVAHVQETLGRWIALENPSHYLAIDGHEWEEVDFMHELVRRTGCRLLVDVANVHLSAHNLGFDAGAWIDRVDGAAVAEIHLAGYTPDANLGDALWIDSHATPVPASTWTLFERLVDRIGPRPTLIERDGDLPAFDVLMAERQRADGALSRSAVHA